MNFTYNIEGGDFTNAGAPSSAVKKMLKQLGVNPDIIKRTVVALYEAEVSVVAHAYKGIITVDIEDDRIIIKLEDEGPGIEDINKAMTEGYSTASQKVREMGFGAGMGFPNMKTNSDKLTVNSTPGKGTSVEIINYF